MVCDMSNGSGPDWNNSWAWCCCADGWMAHWLPHRHHVHSCCGSQSFFTLHCVLGIYASSLSWAVTHLIWIWIEAPFDASKGSAGSLDIAVAFTHTCFNSAVNSQLLLYSYFYSKLLAKISCCGTSWTTRWEAWWWKTWWGLTTNYYPH